MSYVPYISNYKPFYIQRTEMQVSEDGEEIEVDVDASALDTSVQWGMVAKTNPYPAMPTPKTPYSNSFNDEDGDDEYLDVIKYQSFEFEVEFYVKTYASGTSSAASVLRQQVQAFFDHIKTGEFKVYDAHTGLGRRKVRYAGYKETDDGFKAVDDWARLIFSITFKVNDPMTAMTLANGVITKIGG